MSDCEHQTIKRLQSIMTALLRKELETSLEAVDGALGKWREGDLGVFETHAELLKHAARAEHLAERMARLGLDSASSLLRDAYDAGIVEREEFEQLVGMTPEEVEPSPPIGEEPVTTGPALPNKRDLVEELLAAGPVLLHIDARHTDIEVPAHFRSDPKLVLRFGYGLTPAIIDLSVDDHGISGTLTFSQIPHRCILPWSSVYAVVSEVDQKGMVWPEDVPSAVVDELAGEEEPAPAPAPETKARGSHLKLVK